jgi:Transposase IS66 family
VSVDLKERIGVPYAKVVQVLMLCFHFPVSAGALARAGQRIAKRCEPTYEAFIEYLRRSAVVHADETGWPDVVAGSSNDGGRRAAGALLSAARPTPRPATCRWRSRTGPRNRYDLVAPQLVDVGLDGEEQIGRRARRVQAESVAEVAIEVAPTERGVAAVGQSKAGLRQPPAEW